MSRATHVPRRSGRWPSWRRRRRSCCYLALRVRSVELGYELGRAHARVARLREVKRVLELELASHKTPERVDFVARTLLGMSEPTADRILAAGKPPSPKPEPRRDRRGGQAAPAEAPARDAIQPEGAEE